MAEALYRKYRPQVFEDVVGQEHIERTIKNALATDKVSHAYLFTGPRGTGKTTTARLLAKALLCEKGPTDAPDGTCEDCALIADGEHPDVYELDAASRTGVDNVREEIIGRVNYAPTRGQYKVYIIDEVHMLSVPAFNALLKTLEEPPDHVVFILCTTDPQKVPETIHSRCQRFDFRRISSEEMVSRLGAICEMEGIAFEGDALELIAHRAQGGMRDALTSLEQLIAFSEGDVTMVQAERLLGALDSNDMAELLQALGKRDVAACYRWTSEYMETGADLAQFTQDLAEHVRDMYVMALTDADVALDITDAMRRELAVELEMFQPERLARMLGVLADLMAELKTSTNQRLSFEIALTRLVRPESDLTLSALAERIEALEQGQAASAVNPAPSATPVREVQRPAPEEAAVAAHPVGDAAQEGKGPAPSVESSAAEPAQAPVQEPERPAARSAEQIAALDVGELWETALANLKRTSPGHGVIFANAVPSWEVPGELLTLAFAGDNDFNFNTAQRPDAQEVLESAFAEAGAPGLRFRMKKDASLSTPAPEPVAARRPEPEPQPTAAMQPQPGPQPEPQSASPAEPTGVATPRHEPVAAAEPAPEPVQTMEAPEPDPVPYEDLIQPASAPLPGSEPEPLGTEESQDLNDVLAGAFGAGITFTEVEE